MPEIIRPNALILVTGATGFIGTGIVETLLRNGYRVRAALRTEVKGQHFLEIFGNYGTKLTLSVIGDMSKENAFDEAVKNVDSVVHAAAPINVTPKEPKDIIEPSVNGAVGILQSAMKNGPSIQRIVYTSSCAAVCASSVDPITVSEETWNEYAIKECAEKGKEAPFLEMYSASKTLAEKATWNFYHMNKPKIWWDFVSLNPPWVFGPPLHKITTPDTLNSSNKWLYDAVVDGNFRGMQPSVQPGHAWTDVRDVAAALVRALQVPEAGGERILIPAEKFVWQDLLNAANTIFPSAWTSHKRPLAKGSPDWGIKRAITFDSRKEKRILKMKYRSAEELLSGVMADYESRGWD